MKLGYVIGKATLNRKDKCFAGERWILVSPVDRNMLAIGQYGISKSAPNLVVYDELGAGPGDIIGYVEGAEATAPFDRPMAIDAYNAVIIEKINYQPEEAI